MLPFRVPGFRLPAVALLAALAATVQAQDTAVLRLVTDDRIPPPLRNGFRHEIQLISDNDNYTLQIRDGYYTNGLQLGWWWVGNSRTGKSGAASPLKIVRGIELGQHMYHPFRYDRVEPREQDRPFAGHLFLRYHRVAARKENTLWHSWVSAGTIGPASLVQPVQRWYHGAVGIYQVKGWKTQLRTEPGLNVGATWMQGLWQTGRPAAGIDLTGLASAQLGNTATYAQTGLVLRAGRRESLARSAQTNMRVSLPQGAAPRQSHEVYVCWEPSLTYQVYNALLQGGMFIEDKGPVTVPIRRWVYSHQIGIRYAQNRWTWSTMLVMRGRQAVNQIGREHFVSVQLRYRLSEWDKSWKHQNNDL